MPAPRETPALSGDVRSIQALAWSPDGRRLAAAGSDGARIWDSVEESWTFVVQSLPRGAWCVRLPASDPAFCHGEAWRWLRWSVVDPVDGRWATYAAEYFGPLPGIDPPDEGAGSR